VLFSSDAIEAARDAATEWNRGRLPKNAAFDIPDGPTKLQPGYFSVLYLVGVDAVMTIWINLATGQVVEPDRCLYFHGRKMQAFSASIRRKTGARSIPLDRLASDVGCDALKPD
jgi:hypothetical protein